MESANVQQRPGASAPCVAVAVLLRDDAGRVLWEQRRGVGEGMWSVPGGKVEAGETPYVAAHRELYEETGCYAIDWQPHPVWTFTPADECGIAWVTLWFRARLAPYSEQPRVTEPAKCARLEWRYRRDQPAPLFASMTQFLAAGWDAWGPL